MEKAQGIFRKPEPGIIIQETDSENEELLSCSTKNTQKEKSTLPLRQKSASFNSDDDRYTGMYSKKNIYKKK